MALEFKPGNHTTPFGRTGFVQLVEPYEKNNKYHVEIKPDLEDPQWQAFLQDLTDWENEQRVAEGVDPVEMTTALKWKKPWTSKAKDGKDPVTYEGYHMLKPDRKAELTNIQVVNSANDPIKTSLVWGNSLVRAQIGVAYTNTSMYTGLTLYLQGLQLLETEAGGGKPSFSDVSDEYSAVGSTRADGDSDEVPFDPE